MARNGIPIADFEALQQAALDRSPVKGLTHNFYRYPARFSPLFAAAAIERFSSPGDVVLDPYMGGGTSVVEAFVSGRRAVGNDLNELSAFVVKAKTTLLTTTEQKRVREWVRDAMEEKLTCLQPPSCRRLAIDQRFQFTEMNRGRAIQPVMTTPIAVKLDGWSQNELANLATVLGLSTTSGHIPVATIEQQIKWAYHSQALAGAEATAKSFANKVRSSFAGTQANRIATDDTRELPSYDELLRGACKHLKVDEPGATVQEQELYLAQAVLIEAVRQMGPRQRMQFFCQPIDGSDVWARSAVPGKSWKGPATAFAAIGAAQASGFGIYLASTTALGFLTHAAGVTLPFAVYTGMTSLIATAIGPVGCVVAGAWAVSKAVEPNWQRLIGALMCMIATNSHRAVVASP